MIIEAMKMVNESSPSFHNEQVDDLGKRSNSLTL